MCIRDRYVVDVAAKSVQTLKLDGVVDANSNIVMVTNQRGEESEIEIDSTTSGKFGVQVERK